MKKCYFFVLFSFSIALCVESNDSFENNRFFGSIIGGITQPIINTVNTITSPISSTTDSIHSTIATTSSALDSSLNNNQTTNRERELKIAISYGFLVSLLRIAMAQGAIDNIYKNILTKIFDTFMNSSIDEIVSEMI